MIMWSGDIENYCNILPIFPPHSVPKGKGIFLLAIFYCPFGPQARIWFKLVLNVIRAKRNISCVNILTTLSCQNIFLNRNREIDLLIKALVNERDQYQLIYK
jgi:hypothetical protein